MFYAILKKKIKMTTDEQDEQHRSLRYRSLVGCVFSFTRFASRTKPDIGNCRNINGCVLCEDRIPPFVRGSFMILLLLL